MGFERARFPASSMLEVFNVRTKMAVQVCISSQKKWNPQERVQRKF